MKRRPPRSSSRPGSSNQLRIIAGLWRGRKLSFPSGQGLRPTPDRVRETVFNWLQAHVPDARCLDLFAGSGALGLEALSRGARELVFVEKYGRAAEQLKQHQSVLKANNMQVFNQDALVWLEKTPVEPFDLVFLDPPFQQGLLQTVCEKLEQNGWLKADALIYLEAESELDTLPIPAHWQVIRSRDSGQVGYHLALRTVEASS